MISNVFNLVTELVTETCKGAYPEKGSEAVEEKKLGYAHVKNSC